MNSSSFSKFIECVKNGEGLFILMAKLGLKNDMPDDLYLKHLYKAYMGTDLDLNNPQTFNEKLQWLKLYDRKPIYTTMVDKYEVKQYVADIIGKEYIIPTLGVWNRFDEIDFDKLPDQFVLKCTHDSGGLVICRDKKKLDLKSTKSKIEKCLKQNYYYYGREWPYKNVKPRIIAETYLENDAKEGLHDYKVWCFGGKAIYVQYITGRIAGITYESFYDRDWNLQNFSFHNPLMKTAIARPQQLEKLLYLAEELAKGLPFVRVDFYILQDGSIKFGEITFYPMAGFEQWHPEEMDLKLGKLIHLPNITLEDVK